MKKTLYTCINSIIAKGMPDEPESHNTLIIFIKKNHIALKSRDKTIIKLIIRPVKMWESMELARAKKGQLGL